MNNKKSNIFLILVISFIVSLISITSVEALSTARNAAKDGRIIADMHQMRSEAQIINLEEDSYLNVSCTGNEDIKAFCEDIEAQVGVMPVIYSSEEAYCAYAVLNNQKGYYCINSELASITTYISPGEEGYCDGTTFNCPTEVGVAPFSSTEFLFRIGLIVGGILVLIFYGFLWKKAFQQRKEEMGKEENWSLIKEEVRSKKDFYILLILLFFTIISLVLIFYFYDGVYQIPGFFLLLDIIFGSIVALALIVSTPRLIKEARKNKTGMVSWEAYAASLCLGLSWFAFADAALLFGLLFYCLIPTFILIIGFSVSSLIHRGKLNKIIGIIILLIFLSPILSISISSAFKYLGITPDIERAEILVQTNITEAVKECQKYKKDEEKRWCYARISNKLAGISPYGASSELLKKYVDLCLGEPNQEEWLLCLYGRGYERLWWEDEYRDEFKKVIQRDSYKISTFCEAMKYRFQTISEETETATELCGSSPW